MDDQGSEGTISPPAEFSLARGTAYRFGVVRLRVKGTRV
jgi:hypothetical protein